MKVYIENYKNEKLQMKDLKDGDLAVILKDTDTGKATIEIENRHTKITNIFLNIILTSLLNNKYLHNLFSYKYYAIEIYRL